jgi:hypothetical protein
MHPRLADLWKLPVIEFIGGRFRLTVTEPQEVNDVIYGAEWSPDCLTWTALPDSGVGRTHEFFSPANQVGSPRVFVRWAIKLKP